MRDETQQSGNAKSHYGYPKAQLTDELRSVDQFVVFGIKDGKPTLWTSEPDQRNVDNLVRQIAPQMETNA